MTEITAEPTPQQGQKGANTLDYDDAKQTDFAHDDPKAGEITDDTVGHHGLRSVWEETPYKTTLRLFWKGVLVCFLAAFSSFTDGYQVCAALSFRCTASLDHRSPSSAISLVIKDSSIPWVQRPIQPRGQRFWRRACSRHGLHLVR